MDVAVVCHLLGSAFIKLHFGVGYLNVNKKHNFISILSSDRRKVTFLVRVSIEKNKY